MQIPKRFKLLGQTIEVFDDPQLDFNDGATGMAHFRTMKIRLQTHCHEQPISKMGREQTFLHELTHHILNAMEEEKLNHNEKFVNMFAGFLHQALTTMEYEEADA